MFASALVGLAAALPLLVIALSWWQVDASLWRHLADTVLLDLLRNTAVLLLGVGVTVTVLGVGFAWLVVSYQFPGRGWLDWALMLPLAMPPYVLAFVVLGMFEYDGAVWLALKAVLGPTAPVPDVRGDWGVIAVMSLAFYPYVYMLARSAFLGQGRSALEAGRTLGLNARQSFWRIALPMARPGIVAGLSLALMETLADFGAVSVFNYDTFTTAIYKAWFGFFDLDTAAQLASLLLMVVVVALVLERSLRGRARFENDSRSPLVRRLPLSVGWAWAASLACLALVLVGFVLPMAQLLWWSWLQLAELDAAYWDYLWHTLTLAAMAAFFVLVGALILSYTRRHFDGAFSRLAVQMSTLGYALPGSVLAVGIMLAFAFLDEGLVAWFGEDAALGGVLLGSVAALVLAYVARFMAAGFGPIDAAMQRVRPSVQEAARSLGLGHAQLLLKVYLPILRPGILTAMLLVFVEVMKEMPATLLMRPFGWETFAVQVYSLTSEGEWERAAVPAVSLVLVGLIPVVLLVRGSARGR